jgi:hypothetical protein
MTADLPPEFSALASLLDAHLCRTTPARAAQPGRAGAGSPRRPALGPAARPGSVRAGGPGVPRGLSLLPALAMVEAGKLAPPKAGGAPGRAGARRGWGGCAPSRRSPASGSPW